MPQLARFLGGKDCVLPRLTTALVRALAMPDSQSALYRQSPANRITSGSRPDAVLRSALKNPDPALRDVQRLDVNQIRYPFIFAPCQEAAASAVVSFTRIPIANGRREEL